MFEEMQKEIQSMNLKNMTIETMTTKILDWAMTSGAKLVIGIILIVIGFKIINKLTGKFVTFSEKRNIDMTLVKFTKSFISISLKGLLVLLIAGGYWDLELFRFSSYSSFSGGCNRSCTSR